MKRTVPLMAFALLAMMTVATNAALISLDSNHTSDPTKTQSGYVGMTKANVFL